MKEDYFNVEEWEHTRVEGVRHSSCNKTNKTGVPGISGSLNDKWMCRTCGTRIPLNVVRTFILLYPNYHWHGIEDY